MTTNTLKTCAQNKLTPNIMLHTNQIAIVSQLVQNGTAPLVMPTEESFLTTNTLKTCAQNKLTPNIMLHTNQIAIVSQLVQNGTAGTLVFHGTLPECTAYRAIPVQEFDDVYIYLIWNQYNPLSTALKQLIRATKTVYPQPVVDFAYRAIPVQEFDDVYIYLIWNQYNPLSTALKQLIRATKTVYPQPVVDFYCREIEAESPILNT